MRAFTAARDATTPDEIWLVEHPPVFTLGVAGRGRARARRRATFPVVAHRPRRPGDLPRARAGGGLPAASTCGALRIYVKEYVYRLEQAVLDVLAEHGLTGHRVRARRASSCALADPGGHDVRRRVRTIAFAGLAKMAALGVKVPTTAPTTASRSTWRWT